MADKELAGMLVMKLFHARTNAHRQHFLTRSYAAHKALNDFYDEIVGLADAFAEAFQGAHELLDLSAKYVVEDDSVPMLKGLRTWIVEHRAKICSDSELQNLIDEIIGSIDSALYKLRFLK